MHALSLPLRGALIVIKPNKMVCFRVQDDLMTRLTRVANAEGNQVSAVVRRILFKGLPDAERDVPARPSSASSTSSAPERVKRRA